MRTGARRTTLLTTANVITVDATQGVTEYVYSGSGTLSASTTISPAAITTTGITYRVKIRYNAAFVLNGNTITIFGYVLSEEESAGANTIFDCSYIGGAWTVAVLDSATIEPKNVDGVKVTTLTGSGDTVTLKPGIDYQTQELVGSGALAANYVYQAGGSPVIGSSFRVIYNATFAATGSNITIFGQTLTGSQILKGKIVVETVYNGSTWTTSSYQNPNYATIGEKDCLPLEISLETGYLTTHSVTMPCNGTLTRIDYEILKAIAGTDNCTIGVNISGTPVGGTPVITIAMGDGLGNLYSVSITTPNTFLENDVINLIAAKPTAGGMVRLILYFTRN